MAAAVWAQPNAGSWYAFETLDLFHARGSGVYVIWYDAKPPAAVCVGHGPLAARLADRRKDRGVLMYRQFGLLLATWAEIPHQYQQGVARFLTEKLRPPFGDTLLLVPPVAVELPSFTRRLARV
ncbi:MAG: hypothetical protein ACT4OG_10650 [Alphaproteobacteria bacterium]